MKSIGEMQCKIRRMEGVMDNVIIRNARQEDYKSVEQIMQQVQGLHVSWRPDIYQPIETVLPVEEYTKLLENNLAVVAEHEGKVCAVMIFMERTYASPTHVNRTVLFVDTMAVEEQFRGKGIGTDMFAYAKKLVKDRGCDGLELQVNARNTAAKRMYEKCGFTEKSINMELKVSDMK